MLAACALVVELIDMHDLVAEDVAEKLQIPPVFARNLERVGRKHLLPELIWGETPGRRRLARLPLSEQSRLMVEPLPVATVKGDVHDIGKNLVDIILTNNGYRVVNIGIKQTINQIIDGALESNADAIGMSGLLVKSTVIMKENLEEITSRGLDQKWPVILGGAALTRAFVEVDLANEFAGEVRYARDAFEGLHLMDAIMGVKKGVPGAALPALRERKVKAVVKPVPKFTLSFEPSKFKRHRRPTID